MAPGPRDAARHLNGNAESLLITIEQAFPPHGDIAKRFCFESKFFQVAAPESLRLEVSESIEQMEIADQRRTGMRQLICGERIRQPV